MLFFFNLLCFSLVFPHQYYIYLITTVNGIRLGRYGKQKRKIWKTKKEDMENKKGNPFFERISFFCEVSSGVEPLYTVLQTVT